MVPGDKTVGQGTEEESFPIGLGFCSFGVDGNSSVAPTLLRE